MKRSLRHEKSQKAQINAIPGYRLVIEKVWFYWGRYDLFSDGSVSSCSISAAGPLKFLLRCLTLSVRRYSIWPLIERKSSSAQAANAFQSVGDRRSKSCFLSLPSFFSVITSKSSHCLSLIHISEPT